MTCNKLIFNINLTFIIVLVPNKTFSILIIVNIKKKVVVCTYKIYSGIILVNVI